MIGEAGIYDAMPEEDHAEYLAGIKDGGEAALRRFVMLRYNAQSQHIHYADGTKRYDDVVYVRCDHFDEVIEQLAGALASVATEPKEIER